MEIREAAAGDFDELQAFYDRMCKVLGGKDFLPEGDKGGFPSAEMIKRAICGGSQFVGMEDGKIAAAYIMDHECDAAYDSVKWQTDAGREQVSVLHALRVLPEYGGRGYSRQLVRHAIAEARARGQKAIRLDCIEGNDVPQQMYMSFGFRHLDTVEITYPDIGVPRKFLVYELLL